MNILWHSNAPHIPTGYGNQTMLMVRRLKAAGYPIAVSAFCGAEGAPTVNHEGVVILPRGTEGYGNDIITNHLTHPHWMVDGRREPGDVVISLCDPFVFDPQVWGAFPWAAWVPVDSAPVYAGNVASLRAARWVWSMSRFGHEELEKAGLAPIYVPHGIETNVYKPADRREARRKLAGYLNVNLDDKFLIITVAANKGTPSRKNFREMIESFALFVNGNEALGIPAHPDAVFYIHTEKRGVWQGEDIEAIARANGVADKVLLPAQYHIVAGLHNAAFMNDVYNAGDVFMLLSSEGFGIPTVEAQSAGCPVIVSDFSASPELCFGGWTVMGLRKFVVISQVWWYEPIPPEVAKTLCQAYDGRHNEVLRKQARKGALEYDIDLVFAKYLKPAVERIESDLAAERAGKQLVEIASRTVGA